VDPGEGVLLSPMDNPEGHIACVTMTNMPGPLDSASTQIRSTHIP